MGKNRVSYRVRDRSRQYDDGHDSRPFVPTITVERPIIIDGEKAQKYQEEFHRNLGVRLRGRQKDHYHIVKPNELKLTLVENVPVPQGWPLEVAEDLGASLFALLDRAPQFLAVPVGRVACQNASHPRKPFFSTSVVGVEPCGWRGPAAPYATHDARGLQTSIGLLAREAEACAQLLGGVAETPFAALVANSAASIPQREFRDVRDAAGEALPEVFEWQDPVIKLRTGPHLSAVQTIYVRAPNVYDITC